VLIVSWVAAVVACLGYGVSSVLQSVGAQQVDDGGLSGLASILRQVPYLLGLGLDAVAFVANVVALQQLPLFVVQSVVAASVGVTAVIASVRGARLARRDWVSLGVLGLGLILLSVTAAPAAASRISLTADWVIVTCAVLPLVVGLIGTRLSEHRSAVVMSVAAGLGFTGVAVASRGISADGLDWDLLRNPLLYAIVLYGAIAIPFFTLALQRGSVTVVSALTFVIEVVAPSVLGLALFGDAIEPRFVAIAVAGFVLAIAGTISLSRFAD
jgi:drug/metabolite transporter (DMT)-like permease